MALERKAPLQRPEIRLQSDFRFNGNVVAEVKRDRQKQFPNLVEDIWTKRATGPPSSWPKQT
jgi:hypothetical protein